MKSRPEIELYMFSLNQEFPGGKGHHTFLSRFKKPIIDLDGKLKVLNQTGIEIYKSTDEAGTKDWPGQWLHNQWIENTYPISKVDANTHEPLDRLHLREEDFGGIIFDPVNDKIYKVNHEGFALMSKIVHRYREKKLKGLHGHVEELLQDENMRSFVSYLQKVGILPE